MVQEQPPQEAILTMKLADKASPDPELVAAGAVSLVMINSIQDTPDGPGGLFTIGQVLVDDDGNKLINNKNLATMSTSDLMSEYDIFAFPNNSEVMREYKSLVSSDFRLLFWATKK